MKRTELLQEIRRMRFEELYGGWRKGRLSQEEAAQILGVCNRTFRRQICRYEENGLEGLNDKRLTQASHRRAPVDEVIALGERYRKSYRGWNVKHFLFLVYTGWWKAELYLGQEHTSATRIGF